jgi:CRISPR/Cas system CSM-associated protein Csm3 (group 7 of RAMP superfamily)
MIYLNQLTTPILESIPITAIIDTALCVGAGGASASVTDKAIVRNAQGQLIIPGSHLKGRLRHECEKLARSLGWWIAESPSAEKLCPREAEIPERFRDRYTVPGYPGYHCWISQWFGDPILPARIAVNDLTCDYAQADLAPVIRPGVALNRRRQTAEDQRLFFRETSPANAQLAFAGSIDLYTTGATDAELQAMKLILLAGLRHIAALGGSKSAGMGWLTWQLPDFSPPPALAENTWNRLLGTFGGAQL